MGYNSVADIMGLSSFIQLLLPRKIAKSGEIPTKFDLTAVQSHPRSSILVSIESPHVTSYQSLIVTIAVSASFEIFALKDTKLLILPTPALFETPLKGNHLDCRDEIWRQKTRIMGLPDGVKILTPAFFVLTQYRLLTDRHVTIPITSASIGLCG